MKIRRDQMEVLAVPKRRQKRSELVNRLAAGDPTAQADPATGTIKLTDARGYVSTVELSDQGLASVRTAMGREFWLERTADGAPSALGQRDVTRYDIARTSEGAITEVQHDGKSILEMGYGTDANVIEARFADGAVELLYYENDDEHLIRTVDALGHETLFERDEAGQVVLLRDARGHVTHFEFDEDGELERTRFPDGNSEEYKTQDDGILILRNEKPHTWVTLDGDDLKDVRFADGEHLQFRFTEGRPVKVVNPRHTVAFAYNEDGQLVLDNQDDVPVEMVLDPDGNPAELKGPAGSLRYRHDGDDLLTEITTWDGAMLRFSYAPSGQIERIEFPNSVTTTVDALPSGQIKGISTAGGRAGTGPIVHDTYEYDARSRVTSIQRGGRQRKFQYDPAGRLLGTSEDEQPLEQFEYDPSGNRVTVDGRTAFDAMNKLIHDGDQSCVNDEAGNLIRRGDTEFRYNGQGLLIEVIPTGGQPIRFDYDALGRRVSKEVGVQVTRYTWVGRQLLAEVTTRGGLEIERRDYLFYPGEYLPLAVRINGAPYFYHTDRAGTVLAMTDIQGAVVWKADYAAYGEAKIEIETVRQPLRLLGQYHDVETGLHHNLFRYYDPRLGRYLTPDPIRYAGGSTNLYLYANNDPINQCDPDGHFVIPAALLVVAGAALVGGLIGGAISAASGGSFWKGAAAGAVAGAIGAAAPIIGAAAGLTGGALLAVALAGDAIAGGVEACMESGASLGTFAKGAGIALVTTVATLGLAKIPGVRKALGTVGKKLAGLTDNIIGRAKGALTPAWKKMAQRIERKIADRMRKLTAQGHGPQRHEGQVTKQQLEDRAVKGYDPMTGSTTDGVTGATHKYGKNATKINTPEAYVKGETHLRESPEFKTKADAAKANGDTRFAVKESKLEDIYGPGYKDNVTGKTRQGSKNNPTGATDTDFTDGTMTGAYVKDPATGQWNLTTMYPEPK